MDWVQTIRHHTQRNEALFRIEGAPGAGQPPRDEVDLTHEDLEGVELRFSYRPHDRTLLHQGQHVPDEPELVGAFQNVDAAVFEQLLPEAEPIIGDDKASVVERHAPDGSVDRTSVYLRKHTRRAELYVSRGQPDCFEPGMLRRARQHEAGLSLRIRVPGRQRTRSWLASLHQMAGWFSEQSRLPTSRSDNAVKREVNRFHRSIEHGAIPAFYRLILLLPGRSTTSDNQRVTEQIPVPMRSCTKDEINRFYRQYSTFGEEVGYFEPGLTSTLRQALCLVPFG